MIVYLAGGIFGLGDGAAKDWREYAKANLHCETLDPMRRDYRGVEDDHVVHIVHDDLYDIEHSDLVLANCSKPSWGTAMEIYFAHSRFKRIPVIGFWVEGKVSPWLQYHTAELYGSLELAIAAINRRIDGH
jgi:nucleoside 2-deoxyribosyltransferase